MSSDGGAVLLREGERVTGIIDQITAAIKDRRAAKNVVHKAEQLAGQRVTQICCGWEDANDCNSLRGDPVVKIAAGEAPQSASLGSQSTMTRFENSVRRSDLVCMGYAFLDNFIDSYETTPTSLVGGRIGKYCGSAPAAAAISRSVSLLPNTSMSREPNGAMSPVHWR